MPFNNANKIIECNNSEQSDTRLILLVTLDSNATTLLRVIFVVKTKLDMITRVSTFQWVEISLSGT